MRKNILTQSGDSPTELKPPADRSRAQRKGHSVPRARRGKNADGVLENHCEIWPLMVFYISVILSKRRLFLIWHILKQTAAPDGKGTYDMRFEKEKRQLFALEDRDRAWPEAISHEIFAHPELGDSEYYSSRFLADEMEKAGFAVQREYLGLPTAFRCEYGDDGRPVVAFLAEYDALPGYGPDGNENGHACGHNWIAATSFAAALALKAYKEKYGFRGKIVYLGTPAEETTSRKITLIDRGAFKDIDAAFQMHLGEYTRTDPTALAMTILWYDFAGRAAHAAGAPEMGINALDACDLAYAGISCLRQQLRSDVRIHSVIRDGGKAPNIIPDHTQMEVYVRAADKTYLEEVIEKVNNCARGAELMTGAKLKITRDAYTTYDIRNNVRLISLLEQNQDLLGVKRHTDVVPFAGAGSTDIGNVSYEVPTCYSYMGTFDYMEARTHDAAFLQVADSDFAHGLIHEGAKAMAATALDLFLDPSLLEQL